AGRFVTIAILTTLCGRAETPSPTSPGVGWLAVDLRVRLREGRDALPYQPRVRSVGVGPLCSLVGRQRRSLLRASICVENRSGSHPPCDYLFLADLMIRSAFQEREH